MPRKSTTLIMTPIFPKRLLLIGAFIVSLLAMYLSPFPVLGQTGVQDVRLTIFHMNDIHAQIDNLPRIAKIIEDERAINPNVLFFIAGDNFSGNPIVDQYKPKGEPIIEILKKITPSAMAIGNHEFDYGQDVLKRFIETASFPILCANIEVKAPAVLPKPQGNTILTVADGLKVGVVSFIQVDPVTGIPDTHPDNIRGLTFVDALTVADRYKSLDKECDVLIALTHLGYDIDEKLAQQMPELDLIIGGHSHTLVKKPVKVNGVYIYQAGSNARGVGRIDVILRDKRIVAQTATVIPVDAGEQPDIRVMVDNYNKNPEMEKVITTLSAELPDRDRLGNLITDAICAVHQLEVAVHNDGGIRVPRLGPSVRVMDVFRMLPFTNDIVKYRMTAAELKSLLLFACQKKDWSDLKISGLRYTVVTTKHRNGKEQVTDVRLFDLKGKPVSKKRLLLVGMNNYIASTYPFTHKDPGQALNTNVAETVIEYLKRKGPDAAKGVDAPRITKNNEEQR